MKQSPDGRPWRERGAGGETADRCQAQGGSGSARYLLVEDHVHAVLSNVLRKLAQEVEDVLDARRVRQPSEPQAVPQSTRRGQERDRGQHWHQWGRGHRDQRGRGVPIQHLHTQGKLNLGTFLYENIFFLKIGEGTDRET